MLKYNLSLTNLLIVIIAIRIMVMFLPPFEIDQIGWRSWSLRMAEVGPANFYSQEIFTDNPPGFLYVFWLIGEVKTIFLKNTDDVWFDFLLKTPSNIADILSGLIIYKLIKLKLSEKWALSGFTLYALNPVTIFNSSLWGQFDGSATLFILIAIYALIVKKLSQLAAISFAIAWSIKPQAIAFAPALGLYFLTQAKPLAWVSSALAFLFTTLLIYFPFFPKNPVLGFIDTNKAMTSIFNCTTCFAFNFWGIFGNWQNDQTTFLEITHLYWGLILLIVSFFPIFFLKPIKVRFQIPYFYLTAALSIYAFFMFMTRMHERYLFPFFAFLLIFALLRKSGFLLILYVFVSFLHLINLFIPYSYYNGILKLTALGNYLYLNFTYFSVLSTLTFICLIVYQTITIKNHDRL